MHRTYQSDAVHARTRMSTMQHRLTCAQSCTSQCIRCCQANSGTGWESKGQHMHLLS